MSEEKKVFIPFVMTEQTQKRLGALAKRRYGENSYEMRGKVVNDALSWLAKKQEKGDYTFYDVFWSLIAGYCPFSYFKAIACTKLILERYLTDDFVCVPKEKKAN